MQQLTHHGVRLGAVCARANAGRGAGLVRLAGWSTRLPAARKSASHHQPTRLLARASGRDDAEDAKGAAAGAASDKEEPPKEETFNAEKFHNAANLRGMVGATKAVSQVVMRRIQGEVKEEKWSLPLEVAVEVMSSMLPHVLDKRLINLYCSSDDATRKEIEGALELLTSRMDLACSAIPCVPGARRQNVTVGASEMSGAWFTPKDVSPVAERHPVVLYLHGGAYLTCSVNTHCRMVSALAREADARVLAVNYRLAPAASFDEILQDALEAYTELLDSGVPPGRIVVAGDSAGGHLSLALASTLAQERPQDVPAGVYVMSPWIDTTIQQLTAEGDSWQRNQGFDYLGFALGASPSALIFGEHPHPLDNLLKLPEAVLAALPPMLIQAGSNEVLLSEIQVFSEKVAAAAAGEGRANGDRGGEGEERRARLEVYEGMVHVFQIFVDLEPQALAALQSAAAFIAQCTASNSRRADAAPRAEAAAGAAVGGGPVKAE